MIKMKKHRMIWILILGIMVSMITGCGSEAEPAQQKSDAEKAVEAKVLTYVNFRDLRDLNPHIYSGELFAQNLLFESLIRISDDGSFEPWLAENYEVSEDGLTYTFKLREDVTFHDGVKFNAETAKANFDAILDNAERHTWLESVQLMMAVKDAGGECVEATDEYELTLRLAEPYYPFLVELGVTRPFRFISPESFIDGTSKNGVTEMNGTGPYVLKENKVDQYSVFVVNDAYWGAKPQIDKIIAKVIPDNQTRTLALENGEVDLIYGTNMVDAETFSKFTAMDGYSSVISEPLATRMMLMNTTHKILGDVLVRKAILYATDKATISEGIFSGVESPADTLFAPTVPYADIGLTPYEFSREKASSLLDEAGWMLTSDNKYRMKDGKELNITLNYDSNKPIDKSIAEFLQGEYGKVGIKINILGEEEQAYRDRMKAGDFTITFNISWGTPYDPQSFIGGMRNPVYGDYFAQLGLENKEELDQNILDALKSVDEAKRQEHYKYVLETLHNEAVYLPLTYERNRAVFNDKVKNVTFNPSQFEVPMERMLVD